MKESTLIFIIFIIVILILLAFAAFIWFLVIKKQEKRSCTTSAECSDTQFCKNGRCKDYGDCTEASDCFEDQKCHLGKCVQCVSNSDCSNYPGKPVCSPNNLCSQCNTTADCASGVCDTSLDNGTCVICLNNSDCPSGKPKCELFRDSIKNHCVECTTNSDCPSGQTCSMGSCVNQMTYASLPVALESSSDSRRIALKPSKHYTNKCQSCS